MKTTVNSKSLASALSKLSPAIQAKATLPIMECVRIVVGKTHMTIAATNLDMQLSATIECDTKKTGQVCIAYSRFSRAVSAMGGNIELSHVKGLLRLQCGKNNVSYASLNAEDWPQMDGIVEMEHSYPEGLSKALAAVQHAACEEKSRFQMCSVKFDKTTVCATDGHIISVYDIETDIEPNVPIDLIRALLKGKPEAIGFAHTDKVISFDAGDFQVVGKLIEQPYPSWRAYVGEMGENTVINREELLSVLDRGSLANDSTVKLEFGNDAIRISSEDGTDTADCETSCKDVFECTLGCNPKLLRQALDSSDEQLVTIGVSKAEHEVKRQIIVKASSATHVIMQKILNPKKNEETTGE